MFLITATLILSLPMSHIKNTFHFSILIWNYQRISFLLISLLNQLGGIGIFPILLHTQNIRRNLLFTVKLWDWILSAQKKKDFDKHICEMKSWFSQRGYLQKLIENETSKLKFSGQRVSHKKKAEKGIPASPT